MGMSSASRRDFCGMLAMAPAVARAAPAPLDLATVRPDILAYCEAVRDKEGPYGCYRGGVRKRPDLYASCDVAQIRAIMGENLRESLGETERREWIAHINSYVDRRAGGSGDGSYFDSYGHSTLHANGMVIGALGVLGGRQPLPVRLYDDFSTPEKALPWLESIDWKHQWRASHLFWGGMVPFSLSARCSAEWSKTVLAWLNGNLDPRTGWWRRGVPPADRHQTLGGSVHILPLYQHHKYEFPYPELVIESVLALQLENGRWLDTADVHVMSYLELDALYALDYMGSLAPAYRRAAIRSSVERYARLVLKYYGEKRAELFTLHPHIVLAAVGTFGLLQRLAPDLITGKIRWTDIFTDRRFYQTQAVEFVEGRSGEGAAR
jgi:hypothetical protein